VVTGRNEPLTFRVWDAEAPLRTAAFGVQVPETDETVVPDVLVIPCVGFQVLDGRPYRLGYGGGFYDRTLALPAFRTTGSVGVAYDQAETSSWAPDVWDMPLSMLLTPSRCIVAMASP
jgi:5-formyltetrahydrofolate cyclo-ligase family protein